MSTVVENDITQIIKEYEKVPNIEQLLRDCQQEIKILEIILKDSKQRYNIIKESYQTESIFTSIYNWMYYQFSYSFLD
jgi:hypothetical protein